MKKIKLEIETWLFNEENNNRKSRAELIAFLIENIYEFVKNKGNDDDSLDSRCEDEYQGIANIVDVADDYLFNTVIELSNKKVLNEEKR